MKLDVTLNGIQVNYVVTKSLRESIKMCNTFDKDNEDAKTMRRCLQTVLNLYEQVSANRVAVRGDET
jgi:hypothetical protein